MRSGGSPILSGQAIPPSRYTENEAVMKYIIITAFLLEYTVKHTKSILMAFFCSYPLKG